jgi:hypothetical protein
MGGTLLQGGPWMRFKKTAAIAFCFFPAMIPAANAVDFSPPATLPEITEPITPEARREFNDAISQFVSDIPDTRYQIQRGFSRRSHLHQAGRRAFLRSRVLHHDRNDKMRARDVPIRARGGSESLLRGGRRHQILGRYHYISFAPIRWPDEGCIQQAFHCRLSRASN